MIDRKETSPEVRDVSMKLTLASSELIELLNIIKQSNYKMAMFSLSTVISGLTLTLTDSVDEALGALKKAREQIIDTEKEVNQR